MAVDAAELAAGFDHPGGAPAQCHVAVCQFFTFIEWLRVIEIIDSMLFQAAIPPTDQEIGHHRLSPSGAQRAGPALCHLSVAPVRAVAGRAPWHNEP